MSVPARVPECCLQRPRGAHHQVLLRSDLVEVALQPDLVVLAHGELQNVAEIDELIERLERVVAVAAPSGDVKEQIDLAGASQLMVNGIPFGLRERGTALARAAPTL